MEESENLFSFFVQMGWRVATHLFPSNAVFDSCPCLVQLFCDSVDCRQPGSSVHRTSQERILEWVAISSPGDLPYPGIEPVSPILAGQWFTTEPQEKPLFDFFFSIKDFPLPTHLQGLLILPVWLFTLCPECTFHFDTCPYLRSNPTYTHIQIILLGKPNWLIVHSTSTCHSGEGGRLSMHFIFWNFLLFLGMATEQRHLPLFFLFALGLCFL